MSLSTDVQRDGNKPIDLWVVSYLFAPVWSGAAERFFRYGPLFRERNVLMTMVTAMRPGMERREIKNGTPVERVGSQNRLPSVNSFLALAILRALMVRPRPDAILFLSVGPFMVPLLKMLRLAGIPTAYICTLARRERPDTLKFRFLDRLKRIVYDSFDSVVCSTQDLVADMTGLGLDAHKVRAIPNGVSLSRFRPASAAEKSEARRRLGISGEAPIVLYVGFRDARKGVLELLEAWKRYRARGGGGWLIMVGQEAIPELASPAFQESWARAIANVTPDDQIDIRGPDGHVEEYFRAADLFVLLSEREGGTPNVVLEAMASGLPVVMSWFRGCSIGSTGTEYVKVERDADAVSAALTELLSDAQKRGSLAAAGQKWVRQHQDVEKTIDGYHALLVNLLAQRHS